MSNQNKSIITLIVILILPTLLLNIWGQRSYRAEKKYEKKLRLISKKGGSLSILKNSNLESIERHSGSDSTYLENELEKLALSSSSPPIQFIEKVKDQNRFYQEKTEKLARRILVDSEDILEILSRVESPPSKEAPHLIISDFTLKKNESLGDNFFYLDLELLKREYKP